MDALETEVRVQGRLKALRESLGLTTRDVEEKSQGLQRKDTTRSITFPMPAVTDIENGKFTPSIYKLQRSALSTIEDSRN